MTIKVVGFIGLGDIGLPMARNVVTKGFETTVCGHRKREPIEEMKSLGAKEVKTPKEIGQVSDVTIIMVPSDKEAEIVILGPDGLLEGLKEASGILLMGTYSPTFIRRVAEAVKAKQISVLDAPVVGARMGAEAGTLGISVGGDKDAVDKYRPVLETMGKITHCGELGMGAIVKLANNMAAIIIARATYEAVAWGMMNGADETMLVEHMKNGSGTSFFVQNWEWIKSMHTDPPPPTYNVGAKDLAYTLELAHQVGQPCPIAALVEELQISGPPKLPEEPVKRSE